MAITILKLESKNKGVRYRAKVKSRESQESKTFSTKAEARSWANQTEKKLKSSKGYDNYQKRLRDLIEAYLLSDVLNVEKKRNHLAYWSGRLGKQKLYELATPMIANERDRLLKTNSAKGEPFSPATVVRYMASLSHCCSWGVERGWLTINPVKGVSRPKENNKRDRCLQADEKDRLLIACGESKNPQLHNIVLFALLTGMRFGEITQARWENIHSDSLKITETKNGKPRLVPITPMLADLLDKQRAWLDTTPGEAAYLFPLYNVATGQILDQRIRSVRTAWQKAIAKAGLADLRFHDLRHTAASYISMTGAKGKVLGDILGHLSPAAADRYQHISSEYHRDVLNEMQQQFFSKPIDG